MWSINRTKKSCQPTDHLPQLTLHYRDSMMQVLPQLTKVIVILLGQLFGTQLVHLRHLLCQSLGGFKSFGVQNHFSNESVKYCKKTLDIG